MTLLRHNLPAVIYKVKDKIGIQAYAPYTSIYRAKLANGVHIYDIFSESHDISLFQHHLA